MPPFTPPPPLFPADPASKVAVHIFDGGLGTSLDSPPYSVHFTSSSTPLWSSHLLTSRSGREQLLDLHSRFGAAGAEVIGTATYQASFEGFALTPKKDGGREEEGYTQDEAAEMMRGGVDIVRSAFERSKGDTSKGPGLVALSLGPLGATLIPSTEYSGIYPESVSNAKALEAWHLKRLRVFFPETEKSEVESRIGCVAFETMGRLDEIEGLRKAYGKVTAERKDGKDVPPFWISYVFPREDERLPDGSSVEDAVKAMIDSPPSTHLPIPSGIGINCTKLPKLPSLILALESAITTYLTTTTTTDPNNNPNNSNSNGIFTLILYPDGAPNLIYDTVSQQWIPPHPASPPSSISSSSSSSSQSWATRLSSIVRDVIDRENQRRKNGQQRAIWRSVLVGGCCKVEVGMIKELKREIQVLG